jgi:hypothetical protein
MYRRAALLVTVIAILLLSATPATADRTTALNSEVSGAFVGTTVYDLTTPSCGLVHQVFDGTYTARSGSGTFSVDVCPSFASENSFVTDGTFALRDRRGATLTGTVTGTYDTSTAPTIPFQFTLHVTAGTRAFQHVSGTIDVGGVWVFDSNPSPISGTLVGDLTAT